MYYFSTLTHQLFSAQLKPQAIDLFSLSTSLSQSSFSYRLRIVLIHSISCQYPCELIYQHSGLIECLPSQIKFPALSMLVINWRKPWTSPLGMLQLQYLKLLKTNHNFYSPHTSGSSSEEPLSPSKPLNFLDFNCILIYLGVPVITFFFIGRSLRFCSAFFFNIILY